MAVRDDAAEQRPAWSTAAEDLWTRIEGPPAAGDVTRAGESTGLASPLPVEALAMGAMSAAGRAAALLHGVDPARFVVDAARVGSSFRADQLMRIGGRSPGGFAPLSGFFPARDGWVRTHANYPHHRARLLAALGVLDDDAPRDDVAAAIAEHPAREVEELVGAAGGLAAAVRTPAQWAATPQGSAVAGEPLVTVRRDSGRGPSALDPGRRPRVLDLTRVIAGPVATRTLALVGADVLRVDPPGLPELAAQHVDTGIGKRTTVLDARSAVFRELLAQADVVVTAYRPDAMARLGLDPDTLLEDGRAPVVVRIDAWGWTGPWAQRRGFDSIVQAASGIAALHERRDGDRTVPGALPAQALDHATGALAAASALLGLVERAEHGGSVRDLALARTAGWLLTDPCSVGGTAVAPAPELRAPLGDAGVPPPALVPPGGTGEWTAPAHPLGSDAPVWTDDHG